MAKNAKLLELGPANIYLYIKPRASKLVQGINPNSSVYGEAVLGGADGNNITLTFVVPGGVDPTPLSVSVVGTAITVSLATSNGVTVTSIANDVIDALTKDPLAAFLIAAAKKVGEDGTGIPQAGSGALYASVTREFITFKAKTAGAAGNNLHVVISATGAGTVEVDTLGNVITIKVDGVTNTAQQVVDAVNRDSNLLTATVAGGHATDIIVADADHQLSGGADSSSSAFTGGSDTGVKTDVGFLGEGVAYQVTTEAGNLTGAQTGNVPQDKVVIGGMVKVVVPFKEISLDNFKRGVPLSRLVQNSDGSKRRIDFVATVGLSLRTQAVKMLIAKIKGGFESADPKDQIVIPEISPAEGEVNFPFAPTTQREIMTNWYAWPHSDTGRWAFQGDELP